MDRRVRHLIVIGVAVLTAALASFGVYLTLKRMPVREVEVARTYVVVAARALPTGVRVAAADLKLVPWPAGSMMPGSFSKAEDVVDRGLLASVVENEPFIDSKLAGRDAGAGLSSTIPQGMRAMSVKVNDVIGVAGFLDPGTRVDLLVTIRRKDDSTSRTVASNVQVLTSGTRGDQQRPKDAKPTAQSNSNAVVTLLVTPEDAERIALAQAEGQIMLSLRNPLDTQATESSGVRTAALFGQPAEPEPVVKAVAVHRAPPPPPPAPVAAPPPPKMYTVEAIRAAKRSEEVVH
jgi:pilus assembly protein CpaB